jgi:hypothetical protein
MRRGRVLAVVAVAGAVIGFGPAATAEVAVPAAGGVLSAANGAALEGYASNVAAVNGMTAEEVRRYWTPERMAAATPARPPAQASAAGGDSSVGRHAEPMRTEPSAPSPAVVAEAARAAGVSMSTDAEIMATVTAGHAYFIDPIDGREHFCSGATVNSVKRRLVVTAGHCVHNGLWMQGFIFAPGYNNGAPFGTWIALGLAARTDWTYYARADADVGIAIMDNNFSGQRIVDVIGGNGLAWNQPLGQRVDVFSYPNARPTQLACAGPTGTGVDLGTIGMGPCPISGEAARGASGGPMLLNYGLLGPGRGYVASVIANVWSPRPNEAFGPYFENVNAGLFYYAESISP